jgi:hypothetical protein
MATTFSPEREASPASLVTSSTDTALITEQQVLFTTAAAVVLPPARTRRFSDAVQAVGSWLASAAKPPTPVYPKRHVWFETALMSREMDRL